jgi:hypothetical protein
MKRTLTLLGLSLMLAAPIFAQKPMDDANEKAVHITQGPTVTGITGTSATLNWTTNSAAANHVRYRVAGSNGAWKSAYAPGGGTNHSIPLTGLEPGKTYEWQMLTRDGDLRTAGQFQTAATATGTAPDVNATQAAGSTPAQGDTSASGTKVPLYRAVSSTNGEHIYSTNAADQSAQGFKPEGVTGYLASSQVSGSQPLYRLTNDKGDTILTTDANLRASAQSQGYRDGGVIGYVATSQVGGTQPLYQVSNADGSQHFYTTNAGERDQILGRGWKDQGTSGFVWTQP